MVVIHKTALIDADAELGEGVVVGPYAVIQGPVIVGAGSEVGAHAVVAGPAELGAGCRIFPHAVVGMIPQDLKYEGEETALVIGAGTTIREFATVNRGTKVSGATRLGAQCLLMAYSHVAHDCVLGDGVVLANSVALGGHVTVGENAAVGGLSAVHQFTRIGRYAFIGGMSRVSQDIIPYALTASEPTRVVGINLVGLTRRGFAEETKQALRRAYHIVYREDLNVSQAVEKMEAEMGKVPEVREIIAFLETSERGILK